MRRHPLLLLTTCLLLIAFPAQCFAITLENLSNMKRGQSEYFNTNLDQRLTIEVEVVGGVSAPGVYHVPDSATIMDVIALAGGLMATADSSKTHVRRLVDGKYHTYDYDLNKLMHDSAKLPTAQNHDVVMVEPQDQSLGNTLGIITAIIGIVSTGLLAFVAYGTYKRN